MEKDKRKRSEKERKEGAMTEAKKKKKVITKEEDEAVAVAAASEEEVEEFFAILGRMKAVVKYFNKGSGAEGKGWRAAAVEAEKTVMAATAMDVIDNKNRREAVVESGVLDLNEAPEEEEEEPLSS
ncbi:hypothetical protein V6N11_011882 [Hibiscus sabdariffa]|uniref:Uncharacterized protein n=1 Tax=Hibiscus sabdariffa TaxID=183260 RepID=A0ABR2SAG5_9ROSI